MERLIELHENIRNCCKCDLCETRIMSVIDAVPEDRIRLMLVGEAPGGHEATVSGRPFSGQAGQILDNFLLSIGLNRKELYVSNLVKCRPVKPSTRPRYGSHANRKPSSKEVKQCAAFLVNEVRLLEPELVVTLGRTPLEWFLGHPVSMKDVHGEMFEIERLGVTVYAMYHPASLIYNRSLEPKYEEDLRRLSDWLHDGANRK
jgi:DNA polymerase